MLLHGGRKKWSLHHECQSQKKKKKTRNKKNLVVLNKQLAYFERVLGFVRWSNTLETSAHFLISLKKTKEEEGEKFF